jgi:hypothetical protein
MMVEDVIFKVPMVGKRSPRSGRAGETPAVRVSRVGINFPRSGKERRGRLEASGTIRL